MSPCPQLTLKPMSPFLQHRQANMRKMKVKSPEKETATTASEEDQESSLRGVPSAGTGGAWAQGRGDEGGMWLCPGVLLGGLMGCRDTSGLAGAWAGSSRGRGVTALLCPLCWLSWRPGWVGSPGGTPEPRQDPASSWHGWGRAQSPW